jgi:hypothetical protein
MICAETFGCSGKVSFSETRRLAEVAGLALLGNFSTIPECRLTLSIDRVTRCTTDWLAFAKIAISHASRDVEVGLALPSHALACFEFGEDANAADRAALVQAFKQAAHLRNISIGKCHSTITTSEVTSLVIALAGQTFAQPVELESTGLVWISGPLGYAKLLYLEGLKSEPNLEDLSDRLSRPIEIHSVAGHFSVMSDVSGHGLAGCLCDLAERLSLAINVALSPAEAASAAVIDVETSLLENDPDDFPHGVLGIAEAAKRLSLLKETAGPIVGLSGNLPESTIGELRSSGWRVIGLYRKGPGAVSIRWDL